MGLHKQYVKRKDIFFLEKEIESLIRKLQFK